MPSMVGSGGSSFDYVQADEPSDPQEGELWFDTDGGSSGTGEVKVRTSAGAWQVTGFTAHADLTGVTPSAHHNPVTVGDPLTEDGTQGLGLAIADGLEVRGGSGALAVLTHTNLGFTAGGALKVPTDAIGADELTPDGITTTEIMADAVTAALIAADAVQTEHIAADAVDSQQVASAAIQAAQIAAGAVGGSELATDAVDTSHIADDAVQGPQIAANSVGAGQLVFDPATQSELNIHAGDATAHHSRPTSTGGPVEQYEVGMVTPRQIGGSATDPGNAVDDDTGTYAYVLTGNDLVTDLAGDPCNGCRVYVDSSRGYTGELTFSDRFDNTLATISGYSTDTYTTVEFGEPVYQVTVTASGSTSVDLAEIDLQKVAIGPHSHTI